MLVSILHRVTGAGLAIVGGLVLLWWLWALADGRESLTYFTGWATHWLGIVVLVGLTWAFFQKTFGGIRHLFLDTGAGFELTTNKLWSTLCVGLPILLTAGMWAYLIGMRGYGL